MNQSNMVSVGKEINGKWKGATAKSSEEWQS